jgi:hypothetical protein
MTNVKEIAESFINGNISWAKAQLRGKTSLAFKVAQWLKEYAPEELDSFLRIMSA